MEHEESFLGDPRTWVAIAFVIFFVLFGKTIWKALTGLLDKRADKIRGELAEAQRLRAEAEAMLKDAKSRREEAMTEAQALIAGAQREAARLAAEAEAEAHSAAARRERMAMDRISAAEKAAVDEVRIAAADIATQAAQALLRDMPMETSAGILDQSIAQLPAALSPRRAA